ncbi:MAG TPA: hypothetical protein VFX61_22170 [Micromonosporaceae bacterium]|nr:hypothetical protein [Micromonosporaceae bacterium]
MSEIFEVDVNNDGVEDVVQVQELADGGTMILVDTNADGMVDVAAYDADGDGVIDAIAIDTDFDGTADETYVAGAGDYTSA